MRLLILPFLLIMILFSACQRGDQAIEAIKARYEELNEEAEFVTVDGVPVARKVRFIQEQDQLLPDSLELKQIALIRHGEPDLNKVGRFSYEDAKQYIKDYDSVGIMLPDEPFFMVEDEEDILFYTSTLPRAQSTAQYLFGPGREIVESADFREFERSLGNRRFKMRLPLRYWTLTARIEWLLGINREGVESFQEAKARARLGAEKLNSLSEKNPKIVLVAHGFLNRYISKYLQEMGWEVVRDGGSNYFATTILAKIEPEDGEQNNELVTEVDQ